MFRVVSEEECEEGTKGSLSDEEMFEPYAEKRLVKNDFYTDLSGKKLEELKGIFVLLKGWDDESRWSSSVKICSYKDDTGQ